MIASQVGKQRIGNGVLAILREFPHLCDGLLKELCHAAILARCHHVKKQQSLVAVRGRSMEVVWLKK
jgi:hypothetical protein